MDIDGQETVALTVTASAWQDALEGMRSPEALAAFAERIVQATLQAATDVAWLQTAEVSLLLTDDGEIQNLNATFRKKDRATNVLSFPGLDLTNGEARVHRPPAAAMLGDIVMSHERLTVEAAELDKAPIDHFAHLLVHGTLHLLGYDHADDRSAEAMEGLEAEILARLGFAEPYGPATGANDEAPAALSVAS